MFLTFGSDRLQNTIKATQFWYKVQQLLKMPVKEFEKLLEKCKGKQNVTLVNYLGVESICGRKMLYKKEIYISNSTESDTLSKVKNIGFLFDHFKNVTLEGNNTLIVITRKNGIVCYYSIVKICN